MMSSTNSARKNLRASIPETAFLEPYLLTETENKIIDDILELLNKHGLTSHQSMILLERLGRIIERGQRLGKGRRTHKEAGSMSWLRGEFETCSRNIKNEGGGISEK